MKTIKIGKERELLFNLWSIKELKKRFGSLENMATIVDKEDPLDAIDDIADMLTILVNAGIRRKNTNIALGFEKGEKDQLLTRDIVEDYLDLETLKGFPSLFADVMTEGYEADIPEKPEEDEVLKEIDRKNA